MIELLVAATGGVEPLAAADSLDRSSGISLGTTIGVDSQTGESGGCGVVDVGLLELEVAVEVTLAVLLLLLLLVIILTSFFWSSIMRGTGKAALTTSTDVGDDGVLDTVVADDIGRFIDGGSRG